MTVLYFKVGTHQGYWLWCSTLTVNLTELRTTQETRLWMCLQGCVQRVMDWIKRETRESELSPMLPSFCSHCGATGPLLQLESVLLPGLPCHDGLCPQAVSPNTPSPSLNCLWDNVSKQLEQTLMHWHRNYVPLTMSILRLTWYKNKNIYYQLHTKMM